MNLQALSNSIEQNMVNDEYGWGEEVTYTPRKTGVPVILNAFINSGDFRQLEEHRFATEGVLVDSMSFMSLFLASEPVEGDKITYNGKDWYVQEFGGKSPYDVYATKDIKHVTARTGRKLR